MKDTTMKLALRWFRAHPVKAILFVLLSVVFGVMSQRIGWSVAAPLFLGLLVVVAAIAAADLKRLVAIAVVVGLLSSGVPARSAPLLIAGIVIIVGGGIGIVGCKAVKRCNKIGKGRTNAWPEEMQFEVAAGPGESAAYFGWSEEGYCWAERLTPEVPTVFTLSVTVNSVSNATTTVTAACGYEFAQSFWEFQDEMAARGLTVPSVPGPSESYARNLHACAAEEVPITFDRSTKTAKVGGGGVLAEIERSSDLQHWESLMRLEVAPGTKLEAQDATTAGAMFYRVNISTTATSD